MWAGGVRVHEASCSLTSSFALSPSVRQHTVCGRAHWSVDICARDARDKLSVVVERFRAPGSKAARVQSGVSGGHDGTWAALEDELNDGMRSNPGRGAVTENFGVDILGEPICRHFSVVRCMFRGCSACLFDYSMHPRYALIPPGPRGAREANGSALRVWWGCLLHLG